MTHSTNLHIYLTKIFLKTFGKMTVSPCQSQSLQIDFHKLKIQFTKQGVAFHIYVLIIRISIFAIDTTSQVHGRYLTLSAETLLILDGQKFNIA